MKVLFQTEGLTSRMVLENQVRFMSEIIFGQTLSTSRPNSGLVGAQSPKNRRLSNKL